MANIFYNFFPLPQTLTMNHSSSNRIKCLKIKEKVANFDDFLTLAASPGFEPRLTESESAVLPLDDEAIIKIINCLTRKKF